MEKMAEKHREDKATRDRRVEDLKHELAQYKRASLETDRKLVDEEAAHVVTCRAKSRCRRGDVERLVAELVG